MKSRILLISLLGSAFLGNLSAQSPADPAEAVRQRITAKVERVKEGMQTWAASGRDLSPIVKMMEEKVKPLFEAGKAIEAEAELDRILDLLKQDAKPAGRVAAPPERSFAEFSPDKPLTTVGNLGVQLIFASMDSPIARIQSKMQLVQKLAPKWTQSGGDAAKLQSLMLKVSQYGEKQHFVEAEKTADEILSLLGASDIPTANVSEDVHRKERDALIANAKKFNLTGIEDYIGWSVVEPEQGKSNWGAYREDAAAIKKAGLKFVPYFWTHALPKWVKNDPKYVFTGNAVTGLETGALSIFAPETLGAYDHFFGEASREIGDLVDIVRIGSPYDYGETSYPAGAGSAQFPMKNMEPGFWVNEAPARAHFKATMENKYGALERLNAAWGTSFISFETIDYPKDAKSPRYWLDFIHWYQDGFTERMGKIAAIAQKHFPNIPININLGWPHEKLNLGQDISGLVKMIADKGIFLRTPTGPMVPFLYTKRVATAARHYHPAGFSSEPVDASAPCDQMALAYFKDLTTGVTWHFDYGRNFDRCQDSFAEYRKLWANAEYPLIDTALFFPTTSHFLDDWNNWRAAGFGGGFPEGLQAYAEDLRDIRDYDVVDERLISDGFLNSYRFLIWPKGNVAEAGTLQKIRTWVENGGTLLVAGLENIKTVEQDRGAFESLAKLPATSGVRQVGKGRIIKIGEKVDDLNAAFPAQLDARDGVLVSAFKEGTLVYNKTDKAVVKKISVRSVSTEITLAPFQFRWTSEQLQSLRNQVRTNPADRFSVWISKIDGSERKLILSDPKRQISHTRVSPDLKWVVFTTYNNPGADGFAKEDNNYANTEICLFKLGGTEIRTIAGPVPGEVNANPTFSSDGKRVIFASTRSGKGAYLYWYEIETGLTTQVPTPPSFHRMADPHEVKDKIVFTLHPEQGGLQGIWMMNRDGSEARQVSFPKQSSGGPSESLSQGDYDPRMSPDCSRVGIFRNVGGAFHIVVVDVASGKETDLTQPLFPGRKLTAEGVAAWSSDGKLLVFRHIAVPQEGPQGVGIYIMKPDGSERRRIPIAKGEFPHVQPEFFPEGSGPATRVIYQTVKNPLF